VFLCLEDLPSRHPPKNERPLPTLSWDFNSISDLFSWTILFPKVVAGSGFFFLAARWSDFSRCLAPSTIGLPSPFLFFYSDRFLLRGPFLGNAHSSFGPRFSAFPLMKAAAHMASVAFTLLSPEISPFLFVLVFYTWSGVFQTCRSEAARSRQYLLQESFFHRPFTLSPLASVPHLYLRQKRLLTRVRK